MNNLGFLLADVAAITQIALGLAGLLAQLVILISFGALDLTGTGGLKTLGSRAAGFNLRPNVYLLSFLGHYLAGFGARNISMWRPSSFGGFSTVPNSLHCSAKFRSNS